jgi:uracil DNA glycosylase
MNWDAFKGKFHGSWHSYIKNFIESKECDKIYTYLKSKKDKEIAPKANLTFRSFEQSLTDVKVVVILEEPYCGKVEEIQYADGIPLSCDYVDKMHSHLNEFYNAMEREFYGLNLNIIKENKLDYITDQGVMFLNNSLTVEIGSPESHKTLWNPFTKYLIKNVFCKKDIPIVFCGSNIYDKYKLDLEPLHPYSVVKSPLSKWRLGQNWETNGAFTKVNKYLWDESNEYDIQWVNQEPPF